MKMQISIDEFRKNFNDFFGRVMKDNATVVVKQDNREKVVLLSEQEYEAIKDPRKRFSSKKDWEKLFVFSDKVRGRMSKKDLQDFERIVDEEIKAVRAERRKKQDEK